MLIHLWLLSVLFVPIFGQNLWQCLNSKCSQCSFSGSPACIFGLFFHISENDCQKTCVSNVALRWQCTFGNRFCNECNSKGSSDFNECGRFEFDTFDGCQKGTICGSPKGVDCDASGKCVNCARNPDKCATGLGTFFTTVSCESICRPLAATTRAPAATTPKMTTTIPIPITTTMMTTTTTTTTVPTTTTTVTIPTTTTSSTTAVATTVPSCPGPNERYIECKTCEPTCDKPRCTSSGNCEDGCICGFGFLRNTDENVCVRKRKCPKRIWTCTADGECPICGPEPLTTCGRQLFLSEADCATSCKKVPSCPSPNERYMKCKTCESTCDKPRCTSSSNCEDGCVCQLGFLRNTDENVCVRKRKCPKRIWTCTPDGGCPICGPKPLTPCGRQLFLSESDCVRLCKKATTTMPTTTATVATTTVVATTKTTTKATDEIWTCNVDQQCVTCGPPPMTTCDFDVFNSREQCRSKCKDFLDTALACIRNQRVCRPCGPSTGVRCPPREKQFPEDQVNECRCHCGGKCE